MAKPKLTATMPDGTTATRSTDRDYTHIVAVEVQNAPRNDHHKEHDMNPQALVSLSDQISKQYDNTADVMARIRETIGDKAAIFPPTALGRLTDDLASTGACLDMWQVASNNLGDAQDSEVALRGAMADAITSLAGSHLADHEVRGRRDFLGQALFLLNLVGIKL